MPVFKLTTLFQHLSGASTPNLPIHRTGGWSESLYNTGNAAIDIINNASGINTPQLANLWPCRAQLLPLGSAIVGYRIQAVSPPGPAQSGVMNLPGTAANLADIPQMALLLKCPAVGTNNIRRVKLKGIPDSMIVEGEYQPSAAYNTLMNNFITSLTGWQFRARDLSQASIRLVSCSGPEPFTFFSEVPPTFVVNDFVRIMRMLDLSKNLRGGRFQVLSVGPGNTFTVRGWPYGNCTFGSARKDAVIYPVIATSQTSVSRVVTARVGRPFVGYRGRRSKRR